jgi:Tfp pilus assembly protein PilE
MIHSKARGFSLIELFTLIAISASVTAVLAPALGQLRSQARGMSAEGNLAMIGQAGGMYAIDNDGRIANFTWTGGNSYIDLATGNSRFASNDIEAAAMQVRDILYRATGRLTGSRRILLPSSILVHRRYTHLVLADYMGNVGEPIWAHHDDYNQLIWQQNQLNFTIVPGGQGSVPAGYSSPPGGGSSAILQLWHFGSSFQNVPHSWMPDTAPTFAPISDTPHLLQTVGGQPQLGERYFPEVAFPSNKVWMYSEFDHDQVANPYFAYDHAAPEKLMFDGSINTMTSGEAMPSVSPAEYSFGGTDVWTQHYLPIDTFPIPLGGLGDQTDLNMRYRWTLRGLRGVDYVRLNDRVRRR